MTEAIIQCTGDLPNTHSSPRWSQMVPPVHQEGSLREEPGASPEHCRVCPQNQQARELDGTRMIVQREQALTLQVADSDCISDTVHGPPPQHYQKNVPSRGGCGLVLKKNFFKERIGPLSCN